MRMLKPGAHSLRSLTDEDLSDPANAELQVNSAIALFECGYSAFAWVALGHEGVLEPRAGIIPNIHVFTPTPLTGECDTAQQNGNPHFIARGGLTARRTGCDPSEAPVFP